jgi:hypothetical protein
MATRPARPVLVGPVRIQTQGNVPRDARILAAAKIRWLLRHAPEPVVWGRVTLTTAADPAAELPAIARAGCGTGWPGPPTAETSGAAAQAHPLPGHLNEGPPGPPSALSSEDQRTCVAIPTGS